MAATESYIYVVARVHVGRLQVPLEVFVGVQPERHVELFALVDGLLARGERYAECIVGISHKIPKQIFRVKPQHPMSMMLF